MADANTTAGAVTELKRALNFYEQSPDGQYDDVAAEAIRFRIAALEAREVGSVDALPAAWETFCDVGYFDLWCVRPRGSRKFGEGFHVVRKEEAHQLRDYLNTCAASSSAAHVYKPTVSGHVSGDVSTESAYGIASAAPAGGDAS